MEFMPSGDISGSCELRILEWLKSAGIGLQRNTDLIVAHVRRPVFIDTCM